MSTLEVTTAKVTNLNDGAKTVATTSINTGHAKAWLNYAQVGNSIHESFNVSSVTDNTTGHFTKNYTNSMSQENHVVGCTSAETGGTGPGADRYISLARGSNRIATGSAQFASGDVSDQMVTLRDQNMNCTSSHGDLA
tara:strand:+ start:221 stop:634 length:414 start_codon:yes stop_codon:yes gene_type:complete